MLARSLERTGGPEEEGVRMFKDELRESVLKKGANRLGDFEDDEFYLVATLCDPRCIQIRLTSQDFLSFRYKDSFFLSDTTGERARQVLHTLVEAEFEALGANTNDAQEGQDGESGDEASSSILHSLRKRICRDRERQIEVTILALSRLTIFIHQDTSATVSSTLEAYLKAPLEEFKCLRCFENVRSYSSNVNNAGSGNTMSRLPSQMTRLPRLC